MFWLIGLLLFCGLVVCLDCLRLLLIVACVWWCYDLLVIFGFVLLGDLVIC